MYIDLITGHPKCFLCTLSADKSKNVTCSRVLHGNITWDSFIEKLNHQFPGFMQLPYICKASFESVSLGIIF